MSSPIWNVVSMVVIPIVGSIFLFYTVIDGLIKMGCNISISKKKRFLVFAFYVVIALLIIVFTPMQWQVPANLLVVVIGLTIMGHFFCNNKRSYIIYYLGLTVAVIILDLLLIWIYNLLVIYGVLYFVYQDFYHLFYILVSKLITFIMVKIYTMLVRKRESEEINRGEYFSGLILPVSTILFSYSLIYYMQIYIEENGALLFLVNVIFLLVLNIYYPIQSRNREKKSKLVLYEITQRIEQRHYEEMERKLKESQSLLHDIRGHVQTMERLYEESAAVEAAAYAKDLHQMLNEFGEQYYSNHLVLNIILNDKIRLMKTLGIEAQIRIGEINLEGYKDTDITVIFGNIFNNAIEAAKKSKEKKVRFRAGQLNELMSFQLSNTLEDGVTTLKNDFKGIGLKNVQKCVEKYQGEIDFEVEGNWFQVKLMLPVVQN